MSRDSGAHGVQVVGGSNPPCPTKLPTPPEARPRNIPVHLTIDAGRTATIDVDWALEATVPAPKSLRHRVTFEPHPPLRLMTDAGAGAKRPRARQQPCGDLPVPRLAGARRCRRRDRNGRRWRCPCRSGMQRCRMAATRSHLQPRSIHVRAGAVIGLLGKLRQQRRVLGRKKRSGPRRRAQKRLALEDAVMAFPEHRPR